MQLRLCLLLAFLCLSANAATSYDKNTGEYGTFYKPFQADSPWNCKPVTPVIFANASIYQVKTSDYYPAIQTGAYSTGMFLATEDDEPMTVYGITSSGLWNVDAMEYMPNITLPHWPANTLPATGSDGHCDFLDATTGMLHSFWQLLRNNVTGQWKAQQYAWGYIDGMGWGDPSHYYQGARAVGVPPAGGIIRKHEVDDGTNVYPHALALSLTFNSLQKTAPGYIYPACSADDTYTGNSGMIPEGALLMLPPDYNYSSVASFQLRKVAETLKQYGAYVVDRNTGTPFVIYVENGAKFSLSNATGWDSAVGNELQRMRAALRMVNTTVQTFVDGKGKPLQPRTNVNLLSMRGPATWTKSFGDSVGRFDTWTQSFSMGASNQSSQWQNSNGLGLNKVRWGYLTAGETYNYTVFATGGGKLRIQVMITNNTVNPPKGVTMYDSGYLANGDTVTFTFPSGGYIFLHANKPAGPAATVRGMIYVPDGDSRPEEHPTPPPSTATPKPTNPPTSSPTSSPTGSATVPPTSGPAGTTANVGTDGTTGPSGVDSSAVNVVLSVSLVVAMLLALLA